MWDISEATRARARLVSVDHGIVWQQAVAALGFYDNDVAARAFRHLLPPVHAGAYTGVLEQLGLVLGSVAPFAARMLPALVLRHGLERLERLAAAGRLAEVLEPLRDEWFGHYDAAIAQAEALQQRRAVQAEEQAARDRADEAEEARRARQERERLSRAEQRAAEQAEAERLRLAAEYEAERAARAARLAELATADAP